MSKPGFFRRLSDRISCALGDHRFEATAVQTVWQLQVGVAQRKCRACDLNEEFWPERPHIVKRHAWTQIRPQDFGTDCARIEELERALRPFAECFGRADEEHPENVVILDGLADEDFERAFDAMKGSK